MFRWMAIMCVATLALTSVDMAHATTRVSVTGTSPAGDAIMLGRNQKFYLHLNYTSDRPVRIWAEAYFEGKPAKAGSNPSRVYPAGSGEALGWFFADPGTRVDEVRISAGNGSIEGTQVVATYPVSVTGSGESVQASPPPAWVSTLEVADKAAQRAERERRMNTPASAGDTALFSGFMLVMCALGLIGFAAPVWGLRRWHGGWQWAAAVPMAVMIFVVLRVVIDTARAPTSHNLWPFEIVMWGALSCGWMLVLLLARKLTGAVAKRTGSVD